MTEAEWQWGPSARPLLNHLGGRAPLPSERKLRLFACACVRRAWYLLTDERSRRAIETAELYADGQVTRRKLDGAGRAARRAEGRAAEAAGHAAELKLHWCAVLDQEHRLIFVTAAVEGAIDALCGPSATKVRREQKVQAALLRDVLGNPFRPVTFAPAWRTDTAVSLARQMYEARDFSALPILADALQDAGCNSEDALAHCRDPKQVHVRGCWVVDLVLGKN
jgi:hypothetical protein